MLTEIDPLSTTRMSATIAKVLGVTIPAWRVMLWPFLLLATLLEGVLRPLGVQPPIHRRRRDFINESFVFSPANAGSHGYQAVEECSAGVLRSLGEGGHASAGFAENARGATAVKP